MASNTARLTEESKKAPDQGQAEKLWSRARNYVNQRDQMDWLFTTTLVTKPSYLDIFKTFVDGDKGGIGLAEAPYGADEALEVDAFELRDVWRVVKSRSVGDLHEYLMRPTDNTNRVFVVNNPTSGAMGLLGSYFNLDPSFFGCHLSHLIPYHQRIPSLIAACNFLTFRYGRVDIKDSWVIDKISITKQEKSRCSNVFVLMNDHEVRERPGLTYKMFTPWGTGRGELWTSVRAVMEKQISYRPPHEWLVYDPWFAVIETALTIAVSEMMFLLSAREKNTLFVLNGLSRLQFAVTKADKTESEKLTREVLSTSAIGQSTLPENYETMIDCAELNLRQLEHIRPLLMNSLEQERADLTTKDLNVLLAYAKAVRDKHSLVNERTAQVFGAGGFPVPDKNSDKKRDDAATIPSRPADN